MTNNYTLSQLMTIVSKGFSQLFGGFSFWCTAEVSRVHIIKGKMYMDLIELDEKQSVKAKARGIIFDAHVYEQFLTATQLGSAHALQGQSLLFHGRVNFHQEYGFSIFVEEISVEYTLGKLQQNQTHILQTLRQLGIEENNKQRHFEFPSYTVAVISSETSQGLQDFLSILSASPYNFSLQYYYAPIHGNHARAAVYEQLQAIYTDIAAGKKIDVVTILRGGGGSSGILRQNDIDIAKGICYLQVPVMVAIGHTTDTSVLDIVAHTTAKTPSDAAYKLIDYTKKYDDKVIDVYQHIQQHIAQYTERYRYHIDVFYQQILISARQRYSQIKTNIDIIWKQIDGFSPQRMLKQGYALLQDKNGQYLSQSLIDTLAVDDEFIVRTAHKNIQVKVIKSDG